MFGADTETGEIRKVRIAPDSSRVRNPAFDVTPARLITGIITEKGIFAPKAISEALAQRSRS